MQGPLLSEYIDQSALAKPVGQRAVSMLRDERVEIGRDDQCHAVPALRRLPGGRCDQAGPSRAGDRGAHAPVGVEKSGVVE